MNLSKSALTIVIIVSAIAGILVLKALVSPRGHLVAKPFAPVLSMHARGNPQVGIKVYEFTDFQCPACSRAVETINEMFKKYPDKIYLEHKNFPLPMHPFARRASIYAECAASQGKFWPFHDVLFRSQQSWAKMTSVDTYFSQLAVSLGLDGVKLAACVNTPDANEKVSKDVEEGKKLGVNSTPTFFVNGKMIVGSQNFSTEIKSILEPHGK